jgi:hypothetical protein
LGSIDPEELRPVPADGIHEERLKRRHELRHFHPGEETARLVHVSGSA